QGHWFKSHGRPAHVFSLKCMVGTPMPLNGRTRWLLSFPHTCAGLGCAPRGGQLTTELEYETPPLLVQQQQRINPWLFVPVLYFMQAVPNVLVTSTFTATYKSMGIDNLRIATWTGLAALPWVFKMFWGPLVDLNSTKRKWTLTMQVLLGATLVVAAAAMGTPMFFP